MKLIFQFIIGVESTMTFRMKTNSHSAVNENTGLLCFAIRMKGREKIIAGTLRVINDKLVVEHGIRLKAYASSASSTLFWHWQ